MKKFIYFLLIFSFSSFSFAKKNDEYLINLYRSDVSRIIRLYLSDNEFKKLRLNNCSFRLEIMRNGSVLSVSENNQNSVCNKFLPLIKKIKLPSSDNKIYYFFKSFSIDFKN